MSRSSNDAIGIDCDNDNHQNLFQKQDKKNGYHEQTIEQYEYPNVVFKTEDNLVRGLKQRHIQMLALVGIFGIGLFLSSGSTLALAYVP